MEEMLVCLSGAPSNVRVIKAAAKMAEAYGGNLTALYVEPPDFHEHDPGAKSRLEENFRLAHRLGAKVTRLYGEDAATQIAEYARVSGSTKIVIGKSPTHTSVFRKKDAYRQAQRACARYRYLHNPRQGYAVREGAPSELLKAIRDDSEWLITLVENLLCITRIEGRDKLTELEPELVGEVIADAMTHIDRNSAQHKVTTVIADDYLMAYMDARLIEQVLINLVNNAVKYTPAGSAICVSAESSGGSVLVSVSDNGPGIADESKGKIFDMFYTEAKTGDSRRGLGLGLALCKSIVTAHGAVFTFSLPEVKTDEQGTDTGR